MSEFLDMIPTWYAFGMFLGGLCGLALILARTLNWASDRERLRHSASFPVVVRERARAVLHSIWMSPLIVWLWPGVLVYYVFKFLSTLRKDASLN